VKLFRPTLRLRMALLYGGLVLLVGASMLWTSAALLDRAIFHIPFLRNQIRGKVSWLPADGGPRVRRTPQWLLSYARGTAHHYLWTVGLALYAVIVVIAAAGGYLLAKQALRPIVRLTQAARALSTDTLDQRINLEGPDDELRELADTFDDMLARLDAAFDSQRLFVANASHELRTPLSTLIGYTETLREQADEIDPITRERFLSVVHDEARRMQRVVEDLISLSRIEAEKFTEPTDAIDLRPLIEQAAENARRIAAERNSSIVRSIEPRLPAIAADSGQILQLLDNLIANALRYGEAGTPVTVLARAEGAMVHLSVSDEGEGIAPEHIPRLTERFYRVDASRSRSLGGTGLGLSIVKHIVERHRGRLSIESTVGVGTRIHVLLPAAVS
jgi:signal transduction histidine kinase